MKLILASGSEWRKKLISWLKVPFEVIVSDVDESQVKDCEADEMVATLATMKAMKVAEKLKGQGEGSLVIGADTVIVIDGETDSRAQIIGKPKDRQQAKEIVSQLRGRTHTVWTGVCVINPDSMDKRVEVEKAEVTFSNFSDQELEKYLDTNEWQGRAGAYQILKSIDKYLEKIDGSITNVMGLPLKALVQMLEDLGMYVRFDEGLERSLFKQGKDKSN